jgi:hypothetical protein
MTHESFGMSIEEAALRENKAILEQERAMVQAESLKLYEALQRAEKAYYGEVGKVDDIDSQLKEINERLDKFRKLREEQELFRDYVEFLYRWQEKLAEVPGERAARLKDILGFIIDSDKFPEPTFRIDGFVKKHLTDGGLNVSIGSMGERVCLVPTQEDFYLVYKPAGNHVYRNLLKNIYSGDRHTVLNNVLAVRLDRQFILTESPTAICKDANNNWFVDTERVGVSGGKFEALVERIGTILDHGTIRVDKQVVLRGQ